MKKIILILLFGCIYCCAFAQQSDSVIIAQFTNDTAGYSKIIGRIYAYNSANTYSVDVSERKYNRLYRRAQRRAIKDIQDAAWWLALNLPASTDFDDVEYKSVEGGFLFAGERNYYSDMVTRYLTARIARLYFVGYDYRVIKIRDYVFEPPAEYLAQAMIDSLSYKFPDGAENDVVVEPEYMRFEGGLFGLCNAIESRLNFMWDLHHNSRHNHRPGDYYVWPEYPVKGVFSRTYIIDRLGRGKLKEYPLVSDTINQYAIESIFPISASMVLDSDNWSPGSVNGEAVPVEVSLTVSCIIDENPEYDKWPHYTWRELLDKQRPNE